MKIEKILKFDEDDQKELARILEMCNMAQNFFTEDGLRSIRTVTFSGHPLGKSHLDRALNAVNEALKKIQDRQAHQFFPSELKKKYEENLLICQTQLKTWNKEVS